MKGLKAWGWVLFATSFVVFWCTIIFIPLNNAAGVILLAISLICFLLFITVRTVVRAINESLSVHQNNHSN